MNVAILSSGLCRNPISTVKSFNLLKNHLIKNNIKFDLFYYTNDILGKHIPGPEPRIINKVDTLDKESLDYLKNNLNAVSFCVESYNETYSDFKNILPEIKNNFERHFLVENTLSQWHKVYKNYQTLQKHMTDNNVDYDHILVCRADFYAIPVFSKKQIETHQSQILILNNWWSGYHSHKGEILDYSSINLKNLWETNQINPVDTFFIVKKDFYEFFEFYNFCKTVTPQSLLEILNNLKYRLSIQFDPETLMGYFLRNLNVSVDFIQWSENPNDIHFRDYNKNYIIKNLGTPFCPEYHNLKIANYI
jgi:hypothetical protein